MQQTNVAIVGLGTVGTGVAKLLLEHGERIARHAGRKLRLARIVDADVKRTRDVELPSGILSSDLGHITQQADIKVVAQLIGQGLIHEEAMTVNGRTIGENCRDATIEDDRVIRRFEEPVVENAGFIVLTGNLFDAAIMKTSVIGPKFRDRYLSDPDDPDAFEGPAIVFDEPEDYHRRIDDPALIPVMDMVKVVANEEFESLFPRFQPSRVTLTLKDGTSHAKRVDVPKGDPRDPMTPEEIGVKG